MKHIDFYLDFISPYSYLAFERLPQSLEGLSYSVAYKPVLLGALLHHHRTVGPAEVPAKRAWTYRHVLWLGHAHGIPIQLPATHPYNPLPHLRLALATTESGEISRFVAETIFHDIWRSDGAEAGDPARLAALAARLPLLRDAGSDAAKAQLRANGEQAIAAGVFGVPAFVADGRSFWGFDGLAMLRAALASDPWFDSRAWQDADQRPALKREQMR